jgi:hypothetical protein
MAKFEVPLEARKTNIYAIGLFDNPDPASTLSKLGGAFRAESVLGETEIGADCVLRGAGATSFGADLSSALGPFDAYIEGSLLLSAEGPTYEFNSAPTSGAELSTLYTAITPAGEFVQVSGGLNYSFAWKENRLATVGVETFYNELGYTDTDLYPILIFLSEFEPFYLGRHYVGFYLSAEGPDARKNTSVGFSTLGNLSDQSFISRVDFSWRVLTYLTFEAFADVHYGSAGGEFNFRMDTPELTNAGTPIAAVELPRTLFDVGVALKIGL